MSKSYPNIRCKSMEISCHDPNLIMIQVPKTFIQITCYLLLKYIRIKVIRKSGYNIQKLQNETQLKPFHVQRHLTPSYTSCIHHVSQLHTKNPLLSTAAKRRDTRYQLAAQAAEHKPKSYTESCKVQLEMATKRRSMRKPKLKQNTIYKR